MVLEKRLERSCKSAHFAKITSNKLKIKNTWESLPVLTPLIAPRPLPEALVLGYTRHTVTCTVRVTFDVSENLGGQAGRIGALTFVNVPA